MKATDRSAARTAARLGAMGTSVALVVMGSVAPAWASAHARTPQSATAGSAFPTGPVTLTLATEDTSTLTPALIKGFEELHPNVKIVQQTTSYTTYLTKINLELASSTPPDLSEVVTLETPVKRPSAAQPRPLRGPVRLDEIDLPLRPERVPDGLEPRRRQRPALCGVLRI